MAHSQNHKYNQKSSENIDHASKEIKMDEAFVKNIILNEGYKPINKSAAIGSIKNYQFLANKFSCHYQLERFNDVQASKQHLITGFGPTNAPTGGTLSMILRAIYFERVTGINSTIIISNLGAFNSRNINIEKIDYLTNRFIKFIHSLGYNGEIRTHNDFNLLVTAGLTSKMLTIRDFLSNEEATTSLYKKLGIQGKDFPTFIDANYTVADIIMPCILKQKERILVFVGIEEYYFPKLSNLVLQRFNIDYPGKFTPKKAFISATFGHLIEGLNGYPKMSKSIPESSINLDDSIEVIKNKILHCRTEDEKIIFQMIKLVSDWDLEKIRKASIAFQEKNHNWIQFKKEYMTYFIGLKNAWEKTENTKYLFEVTSLYSSRK